MLRQCVQKSPVRVHTAAKRQHSLRSSSNVAAAAGHEKIDEIRERLEKGPNFQDFIQNPEYSKDEWNTYDGKLRREKGENERLRLKQKQFGSS